MGEAADPASSEPLGGSREAKGGETYTDSEHQAAIRSVVVIIVIVGIRVTTIKLSAMKSKSRSFGGLRDYAEAEANRSRFRMLQVPKS